MSAAHPGLTEVVLLEMLDIWLLEHLPIPLTSSPSYRAHREAVRAFAEDLAAFLWKILEPAQQELGLKPPFGGPRQKGN